MFLTGAVGWDYVARQITLEGRSALSARRLHGFAQFVLRQCTGRGGYSTTTTTIRRHDSTGPPRLSAPRGLKLLKQDVAFISEITFDVR